MASLDEDAILVSSKGNVFCKFKCIAREIYYSVF